MLSLTEKRLDYKNMPYGYAVCFNETCQLKDACMHYQAYLLQPKDQLSGHAILPSAWQDGKCQRYCEVKLIKKAWGFTNIYKNVPQHLKAQARRQVQYLFSMGCGPYYRYHHGENKLSPRQQEDIMKILAKYGSTNGLKFDHYEEDFNFS